MNRKPLFPIVVAAAVLACSSGSATTRNDSAASPPAAASPAAAPARDSLTDAADRGRIAGSESAATWFIMVSDFQCPFCKTWHDSTFRMIDRDYVQTGKLRMAFINMPLHANSLPASNAAMCAAAQGKFWNLHDRIFDTQNLWKGLKDARPYLDSLALASGVDAAKLKACEDSKRLLPLIAADQDRFTKSGVGGTPTFFIGNATLVGALPTKDFRRVIDSVLAARKQSH